MAENDLSHQATLLPENLNCSLSMLPMMTYIYVVLQKKVMKLSISLC